MARRRQRRLATGIGLLIGVCGAGGCETFPLVARTLPHVSSKSVLTAAPLQAPGLQLAPHSVVAWSIDCGPAQPQGSLSGQDLVGPDGKIVLGPYGAVAVSGLTAEQAQLAIQQHVSRYVGDARVTVRLVQASSPVAIERPVAVRSSNVAPVAYPPDRLAWQSSAGNSQWRSLPREGPAPERSVIASTWQPLPRGGTGADTGKSAVAPTGQELTPVLEADKTDTNGLTLPRSTDRGVADTLPPPRVAKEETNSEPPAALLPPIAGIHSHAATGHAAPTEVSKVSLPPYIIEPPDILLIEAPALKDQDVRGQHLVRPDGTVGLGIYGSVYVAGMTLEQAREAVAQQLAKRKKNITADDVIVDVLAYNSKFYYVITDGGGFGEQVYRFPITGGETLLDAIGQINGLPPVASKKHIWIARRNAGGQGGEQILPVDWIGISQRGNALANYQVMPGDRIYVRADKLIRMDSGLAKVLSPIERLLGTTLLGSATVNSIKGRGQFFR